MARGKRVAVVELEARVQEELRDCERRIDEAQSDAWHALRKIHDDKLYKADGYTSFKQYVEQRWGYSKTHAYRLIDHSKIVDYLKAEGVGFLPGGEGLTRPLTKLRRKYGDDDEKFLQGASEAWRIAADSAPKVFDVPQVTVQHVESSMSHYVFRNAKKVSPAATAIALRDLIAKISHSDALKMTPKEFAAEFGDKGCPAKFFETVAWLADLAEVIGAKS